MPKAVVIAVLAGVVSALAFAAPLSGAGFGFAVVNFAHLPLFLAGLSLGVAAAAIASAAASGLILTFAGLAGAAPYVIAFAIPAVLVVRQALLSRPAAEETLEWYPPGHMLTILTAYGATALVIVALFLSGRPEGLEGLIRAALQEGLARFLPGLPEANRAATAARWATVFPAMAVTSWLLTVVVNGALAQAILARSGRNRRPSMRFSRVEVPKSLAIAVALSAVAWLALDGTLGYIGGMLAIVLAAPYFFQGLAVIHELSRPWAGRVFALVVFYLLLVFLLSWPGLALVAGLGLVEQWVGLRRRLAVTAPDEEEE
ncbi:MAG: DUF2232 domain-containing protein [Alphaproteobacteria bacterium]